MFKQKTRSGFPTIFRSCDGCTRKPVSQKSTAERWNGSQRPTITFVINGTSYDVVANKDTFITGSTSTTNGSTTSLLVRDSGAPTVPFDSSTYRTYLNFDVSSLPQSGVIQSATLKLYGRNQSAGSKVLIYCISEILHGMSPR